MIRVSAWEDRWGEGFLLLNIVHESFIIITFKNNNVNIFNDQFFMMKRIRDEFCTDWKNSGLRKGVPCWHGEYESEICLRGPQDQSWASFTAWGVEYWLHWGWPFLVEFIREQKMPAVYLLLFLQLPHHIGSDGLSKVLTPQ